MADIRNPLPAKLFTGMVSPDKNLFEECKRILSDTFGEIDLESDFLPWNITEYYREELGTGLFRQFVFFRKTADPGILPSIKTVTNEIEKHFSVSGESGRRRRINIDPGYLTEAKVVLASAKDFSHRVYIGSGIYAEVTLSYNSRESCFKPLDHTYYDFRSEEYRKLFALARDMLRAELRHIGNADKKRT